MVVVVVVGASKIIVLTGSKVSASRGFSLGKRILEIRCWKPGGVPVTDLAIIIIRGEIKSPGWISK